jgi:hypothetical protein
MAHVLYFVGAGPAPRAPLTPRAALPPFDPDTTDPDTGAPLPVWTTLREDPPAGADVTWWRGDAWGITLPGLPYVNGGASGPAQNRVLTYFLGRYPAEWQAEILAQHQRNGYTHISLSPQDECAEGMTEDGYLALARRCKDAGLYVHHLMRSKLYTGNPPDLGAADGLINRLLAAGLMDVETPAWECNYWSPDVVRAMIDHDAALIGMRCRIMLHFYPHYISWQPNDETPTDFWRANYGKVDGVLYQDDPNWTAGMMNARANDCLDRLAPGGLWGLSDSGRGHPIDFTVWETIATKQFNNHPDGDGRLADEDQGNLKGYENLCSPGRMIVKGFGNGGRRPDGTPL